ncbi:MAG: ACP phosphodiesterase [Chitinophagaceae bacterium]|nr:ACP phosphodiesterase [Chitinophagaceae bacterium]
MNYLAHAYFSFDDPDILLGNMISDYIKGNKQYTYPTAVQAGIRLHRQIDIFTDTHPATREIKKIFAPEVRLYAGAFTDVVYDHFLAIGEEKTEQEWLNFTRRTYFLLEANSPLFPERFQKMFPYMKSQNWLYNYRFSWGIERSFEGVARRANYLQPNNACFALFEAHYKTIEAHAKPFLEDVKNFAQLQFTQLKKQ